MDAEFGKTPYGWAFALGIALATAEKPCARILAFVVATGTALLKWDLTSAAFSVTGGCAILLFIESISVPAPVKTVVAEIAGASLFIYLTHYVTISLVRKVFGAERP